MFYIQWFMPSAKHSFNFFAGKWFEFYSWELAGLDNIIFCTLLEAVRKRASTWCWAGARGELTGLDNTIFCTLLATVFNSSSTRNFANLSDSVCWEYWFLTRWSQRRRTHLMFCWTNMSFYRIIAKSNIWHNFFSSHYDDTTFIELNRNSGTYISNFLINSSFLNLYGCFIFKKGIPGPKLRGFLTS